MVEGRVLRLWSRHAPGTRADYEYVEYQFTAASAQGNRTVRKESRVYDWGLYAKLTVGGPITLRYAPAEPEGARIEGNSNPMDFAINVLLPLLLMFAGGWCLLSAWWGH